LWLRPYNHFKFYLDKIWSGYKVVITTVTILYSILYDFIILYYSILLYSLLLYYITLLLYATLYYTTLHYSTLHYIKLFDITLYYSILLYSILYCSIQLYFIYYSTPYYINQYYFTVIYTTLLLYIYIQAYAHCMSSEQSTVVLRFQEWASELLIHMSSRRLRLNPNKTQFIWLGSKSNLSKVTEHIIDLFGKILLESPM